MKGELHDYKAVYDDLTNNGYHIFSRTISKRPNGYPDTFPKYPDLNATAIRKARKGGIVTVRVFFRVGSGEVVRFDGGLMDVSVDHVDGAGKKILGAIRTELPTEFPLSKGDLIALNFDELLIIQK